MSGAPDVSAVLGMMLLCAGCESEIDQKICQRNTNEKTVKNVRLLKFFTGLPAQGRYGLILCSFLSRPRILSIVNFVLPLIGPASLTP